MVSIPNLTSLENARWLGCVVNPGREISLRAAAKRLVAAPAKAAYQAIEADTKVPWFVVAVIHEREASQSWTSSLAQGDPFNRVSTHVPKGRGPFKTFREAAYDALVNCAPKAAAWTDWSAGGCLTILEEYNGLGYAMHGIPSPYIWASTNQYTKGKYTSDGHLDLNVVDTQLGCAAMLKAMMELDPSITFGNVTFDAPTTRISPAKPVVAVVPPAHPNPVVPPSPSITNPAEGSIGAVLARLFGSMFSSQHA